MSKTFTPTGGRPARRLLLVAGALTLQLPHLTAAAQAQLLASTQQVPEQTAATGSVALRELLLQWEKQYQSIIAYDTDLVGDRRVTVPAETGTLETNLARVLSQVGLNFKRLHANNYVIVAGPSSSTTMAKDITVAGRVVDSKGEGLPGVTVLVKGTTTGVSTGLNGEFTLKVP